MTERMKVSHAIFLMMVLMKTSRLSAKQEFAYKKLRFMYPDPELLDAAEKKPGPTGLDHGTYMLSKYVGKDYGIAKKCTPVVVKFPFGYDIYFWLCGLTAVQKDIKDRKIKKAVLCMNVYWHRETINIKGTTTTDEGWINNLFENLKELARLNVVLVAAFGNNGIGNLERKTVMDGYSAIMGGSKTHVSHRIPSMILVEAMEATAGKMWVKSNFDNAKELPHVLAPGEKVKCWEAKVTLPKDFPHEPSDSSGTSQATASFAGLAAYFTSLPGGPTTPTATKKKIEDTAWWQGNGGVAGKIDPPTKGMVRVWNGVTVESVAEKAKRAVRGVDWR